MKLARFFWELLQETPESSEAQLESKQRLHAEQNTQDHNMREKMESALAQQISALDRARK